MRDAFDNHDGVVDHDADRQHDGEEGGEVHGEAERRHGGEGSDDGDRHGGRRDQHRAPVLQEDQDHDEDEHRRLDQRLVDLLDRLIDERRRVERDLEHEPLGKLLGELPHAPVDRGLHAERVRAGRLEDRDAGGRPAVDLEDLSVALRAKLDPADIGEPRDRRAVGFDDDIGELLGVGKAARDRHGVLKRLAVRRRRAAELPGRDLLTLLLQRLRDIGGGKPARLQLFRIEPDADRILTGAEDLDVAHARQPRKLVLQPDGGVVRHVQAVELFLRRG